MLAFALATPAAAQEQHEIAALYSSRPCTEVIATIDNPIVGEGLDEIAGQLAMTSMAWGFLLGVDTALGPLHGEHETVLRRLRVACANEPDRPALSLLQDFAKMR